VYVSFCRISDEASLGSGHRPVYKEDVGGPIDELKIDELKSGDCNAEIASDGKEVILNSTLVLTFINLYNFLCI
jgi:hypothetical protein